MTDKTTKDDYCVEDYSRDPLSSSEDHMIAKIDYDLSQGHSRAFSERKRVEEYLRNQFTGIRLRERLDVLYGK